MIEGNANPVLSARVRELHATMERQVAELVTGEDWRRMLETAAAFHQYSPNNVLLILAQRPDATRVAGFHTWKKLSRWVCSGERGLRILAPCLQRYVDEDGQEQVRLQGFKVVSVFDISQTDGMDIAEVRPTLVTGTAPAGLWQTVASQVEHQGFTLRRGDCGGANGLTRFGDRSVTVRADVDEAQAVKTLTHELGHILLGHEQWLSDGCRGIMEVEAESVAYIVCQAFGMATTGYSLPYVAQWSGGDLNKVRETAERVISVAASILAKAPQADSSLVAA